MALLVSTGQYLQHRETEKEAEPLRPPGKIMKGRVSGKGKEGAADERSAPDGAFEA